MLFNSLSYILFFPAVALLYYIVPKKIRNLFLLLASYYFFMSWIPKYAILLFITTVTTYFASIIIEKTGILRYKKMLLAANLILNFFLLFLFKYYNFVSTCIENVFGFFKTNIDMPLFKYLLPVGISFYTFQSIGYSIDVYRGNVKAEKKFIDFALFLSFFPQLVAGPIERASNLLPQFKINRNFNYQNAVLGMRRILFGFFKKVAIADTIAILVNEIYNNPTSYGDGLSLILATLLFSIQIYCDFSGYSDIAIGSSKIIGFDLMENFKQPYFSSSITEFWNRWHISLSQWFKDYLYIPLGGNRKGFLRKCFNLFIVFVLSGIWHGANLTFIIWGLLHAFYRVMNEYIKKAVVPLQFNYRYLYLIKKLLKISFIYFIVNISWIFFRANTISDALYIFKAIFSNWNFEMLINNCYTIINKNIFNSHFIRMFFVISSIINIFILFIYDFNNYSNIRIFKNAIGNKYVRRIFYVILILIIIIMFLVQNSSINTGNSQFIYFQF